MSLTREQASQIMTGYMAPKSDAINVFAQTGRVRGDLRDAMDREYVWFERADALTDEISDELSAVIGWLDANYSELFAQYDEREDDGPQTPVR